MKCLESVRNVTRPVGYGMTDGRAPWIGLRGGEQAWRLGSYRPSGTDPSSALSQAFHAWLPSISPYGTEAQRLSSRAWALPDRAVGLGGSEARLHGSPIPTDDPNTAHASIDRP